MAVVHDLRVDSIIIGERLRPLSNTAVADLAESIQRVGQIQPITVNRPNGIPRLVTGHHRLMAARQLGWESISCVVLPEGTSADDCLEIEIAENLHRNDLTKDERDRHIRLLADLTTKRDLQSTQNAAIESQREDGRGHRPKGIVSKVADQTGLSKDTVRRALSPETKTKTAADRAEEKSRRRAEQAEFDRERDEHRQKLPAFVADLDAAKEARRASNPQPTDAEVLHEFAGVDRIAELEEAVRTLEGENERLAAENVQFAEMKVQYDKGGFAEVEAGYREQIRVLKLQVETESADKVSWMRSSKHWKKEAQRLGWKPDVVKIDMKTGALKDA